MVGGFGIKDFVDLIVLVVDIVDVVEVGEDVSRDVVVLFVLFLFLIYRFLLFFILVMVGLWLFNICFVDIVEDDEIVVGVRIFRGLVR